MSISPSAFRGLVTFRVFTQMYNMVGFLCLMLTCIQNEILPSKAFLIGFGIGWILSILTLLSVLFIVPIFYKLSC